MANDARLAGQEGKARQLELAADQPSLQLA